MPFDTQALAEVARQASVEVEAAIAPPNEDQLQVAEQTWRIHDGEVGERIFQTPVKLRASIGAVAICDKVVVPCVEEVVAHHEAVRPVVSVPEPSSDRMVIAPSSSCGACRA